MEKNIIRPRVFHKRIRMIILLLIIGFFLLGGFQLAKTLIHGQSIRFDIRDWSFIFWFVLGAFMVLLYLDQEQKAQYYIRWNNTELYYKLDSGPEQKLDLNLVQRVNANYSRVFFYMKDGSVKMVNFYSLDPRFKDVQKALTINQKLVA
mgnify:CR=1 FL=1